MGALQRTEGEVTGGAPAFRTRLLWAVLLSLFAAVTYGTTNALAHARGTTQCIGFAWEYQLPLVSWLVVPYLAIDLLLGCAALFTASHGELRTLARRLVWAFGVANVIFLIWPLRCGFERVIPDDWTAPFFHLLHFSDLPYNQAPSLHIAEIIVVAPVYLARLKAPAARAAFLLVALLGSAGTVLTFQHHVLDVFTGAALGFAVLRLVRARELRPR